MWRPKPVLLLAALIFLSGSFAFAQQSLLTAPPATGKKKHKIEGNSGPKASMDPSFTIPVTPLGFASPASYYLGHRVAQASLNFLDEDHLLFTFRVPGLIERERPAAGADAVQERHIRAMVLALPTGQVAAEALWTVHDTSRYLWMLKGPHFLIRDRNTILRGDAALQLEPFLRFPGLVSLLELDPAQHFLVTDTTEAPAAGSDPPASAAANIASDADATGPTKQMLLRILSMDTRTVQLFSRVNSAVHLPIDGEGYYEALRGTGSNWMISHDGFRGSATLLSQVDSFCSPPLDAVAPGVVLVTSCQSAGGSRLTLLTQDKRRLWETSVAPTRIWPVLVTAPDSGRMARATIEVAHQVNAGTPIDFDDLRGQTVQVYDLGTGKVALTAPASPILDAGGNFALSPSGNRFAVINDGQIQVFDLPPAPPMPTSAKP